MLLSSCVPQALNTETCINRFWRLVKLVWRRVVSDDVLTGTEIPAAGKTEGYTYRYTVTTWISSLRWAAVQATLMFHSLWGQSQCNVHKPQLLMRARRAETESNRSSSVYTFSDKQGDSNRGPSVYTFSFSDKQGDLFYFLDPHGKLRQSLVAKVTEKSIHKKMKLNDLGR